MLPCVSEIDYVLTASVRGDSTWCRYEILTVVNVPQSDNAEMIDARLTGIVDSDARVILLYATPSVLVHRPSWLQEGPEVCKLCLQAPKH